MFFDLADPVPARWADGSPVPDSIRQHLTCDGTFTPTFVGERVTGGGRGHGGGDPGTDPAARHVPRSGVSGAVVHPDPLARRPPRRPPRTRRRDRARQPGGAVSTVPPGPPPWRARHPRQRRHPRRAHVQRPCRHALGGAPTITPPAGPPPDPPHPYQHPPGNACTAGGCSCPTHPRTHQAPLPDRPGVHVGPVLGH